MTCVVGLVHENEIWIGGDQMVSYGFEIMETRNPKITLNPPFILGVAGDLGVTQAIQHSFMPPDTSQDISPHGLQKYMLIYTEKLKGFLEGKYVEPVRSLKEDDGGKFVLLVGLHGHLYRVDCGFSVTENAFGFDAIGTGAPYALGALHAMPQSIVAVTRVRIALGAAAFFCSQVREPFTVLKG